MKYRIQIKNLATLNRDEILFFECFFNSPSKVEAEKVQVYINGLIQNSLIRVPLEIEYQSILTEL